MTISQQEYVASDRISLFRPDNQKTGIADIDVKQSASASKKLTKAKS